jgi:hypothetical protein
MHTLFSNKFFHYNGVRPKNQTSSSKKFNFFIDVILKPLYKGSVLSGNASDKAAKAEWQNGYAEDCKSFDIGSIPVSASKEPIPR